MRIRRSLPILLLVVAIAAAVTLAVQLRKNAPPEPARLLPGGDAFFYLNLGWARKLNAGKPLPSVSHDPEYQHFIEQTGFEFERDLESVAFAVHYPANWPGGGTGGNAPESRFSEVLEGKFDGQKLAAYLKQIAKSVETYESVDIYTIPIQNRMFRVAILGVDSVAGSNHDDPAVIRGIVDRSRRLASPFGGPALLRKYYKKVQLASPVWFMARTEPREPSLIGGMLPAPADVVISANYNPLHLPFRLGVVHLRAEAYTTNSSDARAIADRLDTIVGGAHAAESSAADPANDADWKAMLSSLQVRQFDTRAVLVATVPAALLHKMFTSGTDAVEGAAVGKGK